MRVAKASEQTTAKCPVMIGLTKIGKGKLIYCGQWSCPQCSKKLARKWARRTREHMQYSNQEWWMLTLTLGSGYKDVPRAYKALRGLWDRMRKALSREDAEWQYCAFVEGQPHRQSMPHLHILLNFCPTACTGKHGTITRHATHGFAHKMGWGFEAELKPVESLQAGDYIAKYLSKGSGIVPKNFRRVRVSREWRKTEKNGKLALFVPARGESLSDFLLRVHNATDIEIETLYTEWIDIRQKFVMLDANQK